MRPKVLLVTTMRWFGVARLAMGLKHNGFVVELVCPKDHPVLKTRAAHRTYTYRALFPIPSIEAAIAAAEPALVIPCDDLATVHLHSLYRRQQRSGPSAGSDGGSSIASLLQRSLGDPASFPTVAARSKLLALAEAEGVRVPTTTIVRDLDGMHSWLNAHGLPAVLKTDGTSGGVGVRLVSTLQEADRAFADLDSPPLLARAVKRAVIDHDFNLITPCLLRRRPLVNIQSLILGHDATSTVMCWEGKILASLAFDVLHTWKPKGPASVLQLNENLEMRAAAEKIVSRLNLSGIYGFDFMIEDVTGKAYLIEMNARATQTCHLPLGPGRDLLAVLWPILSGEPALEMKSVTDNPVVALFPQEWQRNPASTFLWTAYHDVPWEEPEFVRECVQSPPDGGAWSFEALAQFSSKLPWYR